MPEFGFAKPVIALASAAQAQAPVQAPNVTVTVGAKLQEQVEELGPREVRDQADRLAERFLGIVRATIKGTGVVAVVQGALGWIALMIAGVPSALLFGVLMAIFALVPVIGAGAVWLPAGLYLLISGATWQGVFVLLVGFFVISSADNVLRPILVGRDTGIPDWIILVTTLGGISLLGFSGIVVGPLVAGLFLASWSILREQRQEDEEVEVREGGGIRVDADGHSVSAAEG